MIAAKKVVPPTPTLGGSPRVAALLALHKPATERQGSIVLVKSDPK